MEFIAPLAISCHAHAFPMMTPDVCLPSAIPSFWRLKSDPPHNNFLQQLKISQALGCLFGCCLVVGFFVGINCYLILSKWAWWPWWFCAGQSCQTSPFSPHKRWELLVKDHGLWMERSFSGECRRCTAVGPVRMAFPNHHTFSYDFCKMQGSCNAFISDLTWPLLSVYVKLIIVWC